MDYIKLEAWRALDTQLIELKKQEMALRKELFKEVFNTEEEGAHQVDLPEGWKLKATVPYTRSLDQSKMEETLKALKKAKADPDLIKIKYDLSVAEYRKLNDKVRAIVDAALTTKPGCPSMELIAPKV